MQQITDYELSLQQRRLWRRQQLDGSAAYSAQAVLALEGNIQPERLKAAVAQVVSRHEILRTGFLHLAGNRQPLATIRDDAQAIWEVVDLRGAAVEAQSAALERLWHSELRREQRPEQFEVLHAKLALLSDQNARLFLHLPALCADAQTLRNLSAEISRTYAAVVQGGEVDQEPLQYADVSEWQNELLESDDAARGENYWRDRYSAQSRTRSSATSFDPKVVSSELDPQLLEKLATLPLYAESPSLFLLSCWLVLLWRLGGSADETFVAVAHDGRAYDELKDALGLLEKYLPVGCHPQPGERLSDVAARVKQTLRETEKWQEYFNWENVNRSEDLEAEFLPFAFDYAGDAEREWQTPSVKFTIEREWVCTDRFNVKLRCVRVGHTITTEWHYDESIYNEHEMRQLAERYYTLLASEAADPEKALGELRVVGADERRRLLVEWNTTAAEYPRERCIHELFEAQVERTPNAVALVSGVERFTYAMLNVEANRLAHFLQQSGVGPEVVVGVLMERSIEMVVSLLAILKAGGAYVPLDSSYPSERLSFMLSDSQAAVLLTNGEAADGLVTSNTRVIHLDGTWESIIAGQRADNPANRATPDNLAYVIYTSGSTGRPKGAMITHQGLVNYLSWAVQAYAVSEGSGAPVHSSISFDLTVTSLFTPLLAGRAVELLDEEHGVEALATSLLNREEELSLIKITPAHLVMLNHLLPPDKTEAHVRTLVIGGEALRSEILATWREAGKRLINEYGPTETVVGCIIFEVGDEAEGASAPEMVLIGRPIANSNVYILDERLEPVAIGTAGEIYLGGDGVARGYLNRPEITAERFVPHPFASAPGRRLYRSGDLGRYLPSGQIEYLGRTDYQVKVRGYRIELGEIEACLREHESVADAVVTLHEDASGSGHLIGYVVSEAGVRPAESELQRHLAGRLPDYMVPARFVVMDKFPLTPNGKVDREALPAPEEASAHARESAREYQSLLEEMLADIWCHILGVQHVGVNDNFFDLGGHSLSAVRLISRLREVFDVEVTLDDIFEAGTLSALAKRVAALVAKQSGATEPIRAVARDEEIPLSFAQQRLWFLDQLMPGGFAYNLPMGFRLRGRLDIPALEKSLNEMLRRHESLRTTFADVGGRPRQVIAPAATIDLPIIDLSHLEPDEREEEVIRLLAEEARKPFDLVRGPLLRTTLLRLDADHHVMLSTMHHIISDGWSMSVLISEVVSLYEEFSGGRPSSLPELPIQYADYAVWQRGWLTDEVLETQLSYWRNQLADAPPVLNLPTDFPRPPIQSHRGATSPVRLPVELATALKSLSKGEGMTLFMTILASFSALLSRYSGQSDVVIGVPTVGRNRSEVENLIGFFVNTLPLRVNLEGDPSFRTLLEHVRQSMLGGYAHQDIPFEKLVEALHPVRDRSRSPLFQVSLVWNNFELQEFNLGELEMTALDAGGQTAKFDLTLALTEDSSGTVTGDIEYATELFEESTIQRLAEHFQNLLKAVAANPEKRLSEISILSPRELQQFVEWNDTSKVYFEKAFLPELFAAQVERTPGTIAVASETEELTYQELNQRANRLAHRLQELGVGPEVLVGIMADRSVELVIGLLGILKAGGAYVPFDVSNPQERLSYMLQDSGVSVLLTQAALRDRLTTYSGVVVCLDNDDESTALASSSNPELNLSADNLAYMIYTSGSTGRPKGVMNTHGGIRNRLLWIQHDLYELTPEDCLLQKTPYIFDVSVWEFFWPLLNGACLVMARPGGHRDSAYLTRIIAEKKITTIHFVPSMLRAFLAEPSLAGTESLRGVFCSGEALTLDLQELFYQRLDAKLYNLYGPTEAAVEVSFWGCKPDDGRGTVPIGWPIANIQLHILDQKLRPVPVGVVGDLYIAGVGLARGYLHQPDLTAENFIPNPFSEGAATRLYRTGDLARYRPNGAIEFLGRSDYQIKVRGYRMELGEIETVLCEHAAVQDAVVVAKEDGAGGKRLISYVVLRHSQALDAGELRHHAQSHLPEYMVPAAFVFLDEMPLTGTGKIDRRSLPDVEEQRPDGGTPFEAPRTPFEEQLCEIWSDLLRINHIGVHDNFFELGGHSLLATQLISRIRETFQVELPLQAVFEFSTVSELTKAITAARAAQENMSEVTELLEQLKQLTPDDVKMRLNS